MSKPELKPCPFCGKAPSINRRVAKDFPYMTSYVVVCFKSHESGSTTQAHRVEVHDKSEREASKTWNRRAS